MSAGKEDEFVKELDDLAPIQIKAQVREQSSKKSQEELEQERFNSLMDNYLELRRKRRIESRNKAQQEESNTERMLLQEKQTKREEEKCETPLNWLFAVDYGVSNN